MTSVLSGPFLAAAGVLCVSGVAKLRSPGPARQALVLLGLPSRRGLVRGLAAAELGLGAAGLTAPGTVTGLLVALAYATFAVVAARLAALRASCGCFGESQGAASPVQSWLSAALAALALAAAAWPPHGVGWVLGRPAAQALTLAVGAAGCVYGLVVAYTQLPGAWRAWGTR